LAIDGNVKRLELIQYVIPVKTGIQQLQYVWMPDQVRHDGQNLSGFPNFDTSL
jgi:hypothetical protein